MLSGFLILRKRMRLRQLALPAVLIWGGPEALAATGLFEQMFQRMTQESTEAAQSTFNPGDYAALMERQAQVNADNYRMALVSRGMNASFAEALWNLPATQLQTLNLASIRTELASEEMYKAFGFTSPDKVERFRAILRALRARALKSGKTSVMSEEDIEKVAQLLAQGKTSDGQVSMDSSLLASVQAQADNLNNASSDSERQEILASLSASLGELASSATGTEAGELLGNAHATLGSGLAASNTPLFASFTDSQESTNPLFGSLNDGTLFSDLQMKEVPVYDEGSGANSETPSNSWLKKGDVDRLLSGAQNPGFEAPRSFYAGYRPPTRDIASDAGANVDPGTPSSSDSSTGPSHTRDSGSAGSSLASGGDASIRQRLDAIARDQRPQAPQQSASLAPLQSKVNTTPEPLPMSNTGPTPAPEAAPRSNPAPAPESKPSTTNTQQASQNSSLLEVAGLIEANNRGLSGKAADDFAQQYIRDGGRTPEEMASAKAPARSPSQVADSWFDPALGNTGAATLPSGGNGTSSGSGSSHASNNMSSGNGAGSGGSSSGGGASGGSSASPSPGTHNPDPATCPADSTVAELALHYLDKNRFRATQGESLFAAFKKKDISAGTVDDSMVGIIKKAMSVKENRAQEMGVAEFFEILGNHMNRHLKAAGWCPKDLKADPSSLEKLSGSELTKFQDSLSQALTNLFLKSGATKVRNNYCPEVIADLDSPEATSLKIFTAEMMFLEAKGRGLLPKNQDQETWCNPGARFDMSAANQTPWGRKLSSCKNTNNYDLLAKDVGIEYLVTAELKTPDRCLAYKSATMFMTGLGYDPLNFDLPDPTSNLPRLAESGSSSSPAHRP